MIPRAFKRERPTDHYRATLGVTVAHYAVAVVKAFFGERDGFDAASGLIRDAIPLSTSDHHDVAGCQRASERLCTQFQPGAAAFQDMKVHHVLSRKLNHPGCTQFSPTKQSRLQSQ